MGEFKKIGIIMRKRAEELIKAHSQLKVSRGPKAKFYMPNDLVRKYLPLIKNRYGQGTACGVAKIMMVLSTHSNKDGISWPALTTIMKEGLISNKNQLIKQLKFMEKDLNMIKFYPGKGRISNVYMLTDITQWKPVNSIIAEINSIKNKEKIVSRVVHEGVP